MGNNLVNIKKNKKEKKIDFKKTIQFVHYLKLNIFCVILKN